MSSDISEISEPSITEAQAALDDVRSIVDNVPFDTVKAVEPLAGLEEHYYRVRFYQGTALSVKWLHGRETFKEAVRNALLRYFTGDGSDKFADHQDDA